LKLPWREAGPPNHHNDEVDSDQYVVNKELFICFGMRESRPPASRRASPTCPHPPRHSACPGVPPGPISSSLLGPVDPSFRALSGRLKFTARRHKFNEDSLFSCPGVPPGPGGHATRPVSHLSLLLSLLNCLHSHTHTLSFLPCPLFRTSAGDSGTRPRVVVGLRRRLRRRGRGAVERGAYEETDSMRAQIQFQKVWCYLKYRMCYLSLDIALA